MITQPTTDPNGNGNGQSADAPEITGSVSNDWTTFLRQKAHPLAHAKYTVLRRAGFRCQYCDRDFLTDYDSWRLATVDHLIPKRSGGSDTESNMVACCQPCNWLKNHKRVKSVEEARDFINGERINANLRLAELLGSIGIDFPRGPSVHRVDRAGMETLTDLLRERIDAIVSTVLTAVPASVEVVLPSEESQVTR